MSVKRDSHWGNDGQPGERMAAQAPAGANSENLVHGGPICGQPIARVEFFRRMPTGGTAYLKTSDSQD